MYRIVPSKIEYMSAALLNTPVGEEPDPANYIPVANKQYLSGLDNQQFGGPSILMYCLERDGAMITACLIIPLSTSNATSPGVKDAAIYGCARFSGQAGKPEVTVVDEECPHQLIDWFTTGRPDPPEEVSLSSYITSP